ncbi:MAG: radical SAM protein [Deltaproteobacteria bacterium]|nr:radical SAM protein [Deltaproteobacteria bacterium]
MTQTIIRNVKSLSPLTYKEIDAQVINQDGKVFLEKRDEEGQVYRTLMDTDYDFFQRMTRDRVDKQVPPNSIDLYVSSVCNLNCPLCYEDIGGKEELSLPEIENLLRNVKGKVVVLMGREPTCRKDIFEVIKLATKHNRACLLTNGIKLADYGYAVKLKEAGLDVITFSFNGFNDEIYRKTNGKPLLDVKLKALDNVKKLGIKTCLSVTLARGVNDDQIKQLCDYCFDNQSFIYELRIRTAEPIGRHIDGVEPFCMSEMIDLVSKSLQLQKADILKEYDFWEQLVATKLIPVPTVIRRFVRTRLCSFNFHIRRDAGKYSCLGSHVDLEAIKHAKFKQPLMVYYLLKSYGLQYILNNLSIVFKLPYKGAESNSMMVVLRSWPNVYNVDMAEIMKCPSQYYKRGQFLPFCYANIMEGKESLNKEES